MQTERMRNIRDSEFYFSSLSFTAGFSLQSFIDIKLNEERKVTRAVSNYTVDLFNVTAVLSCETFSALYVFHGALQ